MGFPGVLKALLSLFPSGQFSAERQAWGRGEMDIVGFLGCCLKGYGETKDSARACLDQKALQTQSPGEIGEITRVVKGI